MTRHLVELEINELVKLKGYLEFKCFRFNGAVTGTSETTWCYITLDGGQEHTDNYPSDFLMRHLPFPTHI